MEMGCCGCFGFSFAKKHKKNLRPRVEGGNLVLQGLLLNQEVEEEEEDEEEEEEEEENNSYCDNITDTDKGDCEEIRNPSKNSQEILVYRTENGLICREFPVKETHKVVRSEVIFKRTIISICGCLANGLLRFTDSRIYLHLKTSITFK